ncbi:hypothetical protein CHCC20342_2593 [Bacillus licheniformis]|nr:hypothetical protein CHCC20342_2593 [Bacillus licheniformis]
MPDSVFPDSGPITDRTFIFNSEVKEDFREAHKSMAFKKQANPDIPYQVNVQEIDDATEVKPFKAKIKIQFHNKEFQKRMFKLNNHNRYYFEWRFEYHNTGTFFKPIDEMKAVFTMKEAILNQTADLIVKGLVDIFDFTTLFKDWPTDTKVNVKEVFRGKVFHFKSKSEREIFAEGIKPFLDAFLDEHYKSYQQLNRNVDWLKS